MSEKNEKLKRKYPVKSRRKPEPIYGHSSALCASGFHDFGRPWRDIHKRHDTMTQVSRFGRLLFNRNMITVIERGPRTRTCRACNHQQAQAKSGQWLNVRV